MATTVISAFAELHSRQSLTRAQQETASTRVGSLRGFFSSHFEMREPVFAVGSYDRKTICDRERDIDLTAPFEPYGEQGYWDRYKHDSQSFLYWVRGRLNDHYHATRISSRQVCVKLDFTRIETDVTPCFPRRGGGYLMPDGRGGWMATNPPYHTELMDRANRDHDWDLKPLIRLIKWWNIANGHHLRSFHVELMAERIQRDRTMGSYPEEVAYTLRHLQSLVQKTFHDPWSDGARIDGYLSFLNRQKVVNMLRDDAKRAEKAEEYRKAGKTEAAFERWDIVYRQTFPAYG